MSDLLETTSYVKTKEDIVGDVVCYFTKELGDVLVYPAKSYAVALIYATLLVKYFNEDFFLALDDPLLLYGNDQYFIPYSRMPGLYDQMIAEISREDVWDIENSPLSQMQATINYFKQEFLLS